MKNWQLRDSNPGCLTEATIKLKQLKPSRLGIVMKIANEVSKKNKIRKYTHQDETSGTGQSLCISCHGSSCRLNSDKTVKSEVYHSEFSDHTHLLSGIAQCQLPTDNGLYFFRATRDKKQFSNVTDIVCTGLICKIQEERAERKCTWPDPPSLGKCTCPPFQGDWSSDFSQNNVPRYTYE